MTREQSIQELDLKFAPLLAQLSDALTTAQFNLSQAQAQYSELQRQINEYYDAVAIKANAETTIAKGVPDTKVINDSVAALAVAEVI